MFMSLLARLQDDMPSADAGPGIVGMIFPLLIAVVMIASMWKVFAKAGEPGFAAIVPIWNVIVLLKLAGKPIWWIILLFIPIVGVIINILVAIEIAKKFGKGAGFGLGLILLPFIFWPMLGFGSATYQG